MSTFYRQIEEKPHGPREEICAHVKQYRPLLEWLRQRTSQPVAIDLGCRCGKFLDLAADVGFGTIGVDLDDELLTETAAAGPRNRAGDCNTFLRNQPTSAAALIRAVHFVQHLPLENLRDLVVEAFRVLAPGGVLILETRDPENLTASAHTAGLDLSRLMPLPPGLLRFVVEDAGFQPFNALRVNEGRAPVERRMRMADLVAGVSPYHGAIGTKPDGSQPFDIQIMLFEKHGHSPERIDGDVEARLSAVDADRFTSRQITEPLRAAKSFSSLFVKGIVAWLLLKPGSRPRRIARGTILSSATWIAARPTLATPIRSLLRRFPPSLESRLRALVTGRAASKGSEPLPAGRDDLSPRAREILDRINGQ